MLKVWGRRSSFNVQKVMWLVGELSLEHQHVDAGGRFGGLDTSAFLAMRGEKSGVMKAGLLPRKLIRVAIAAHSQPPRASFR